eukprot:gene23269-3326_t
MRFLLLLMKRKPGGLGAELLDNLRSVDGDPAMRDELYARYRKEFPDYDCLGLHRFVLVVWSQAAPDTDRMMGFDDAPEWPSKQKGLSPPEVAAGKQVWKTYLEEMGTRTEAPLRNEYIYQKATQQQRDFVEHSVPSCRVLPCRRRRRVWPSRPVVGVRAPPPSPVGGSVGGASSPSEHQCSRSPGFSPPLAVTANRMADAGRIFFYMTWACCVEGTNPFLRATLMMRKVCYDGCCIDPCGAALWVSFL